jgi:HD-GYP domain-containing protein (c-di-GMP phosphodiesterase class II)
MADLQGEHGKTPLPPSQADPQDAVLQERGAGCVQRFAAMLRIARTHGVTNEAFRRYVPEFLSILTNLFDGECEITLTAVDSHFYLNGVRLTLRSVPTSVSRMLLDEFKRRQVGGIRFLPGLGEDEFLRFCSIFVGMQGGTELLHLTTQMDEAGVASILLMEVGSIWVGGGLPSTGKERGPRTDEDRARGAYFAAVLGTKKLLQQTQEVGYPSLREAKRMVQPLVDSVMRHQYSIIGLTAIKKHDDYTFRHCVNVGILSLAMGHKLRFNRRELAELGVVALLHDVGKLIVPAEVLCKPDALTDQEWASIRSHPIAGAKVIVRMPGLSRLMLNAMRVCLQHHLNVDGSGYPELKTDRTQSTMTRIVSVADYFDALTAHRAYRARPFTPFESLQHVVGLAGAKLDPAVVWALVKTVGHYPAGSFLQVGSGHVVLSVRPNPDDLFHPVCRIIRDPDGREIAVDDPDAWWIPMPSHERVIRVLEPEECDVDCDELLAA